MSQTGYIFSVLGVTWTDTVSERPTKYYRFEIVVEQSPNALYTSEMSVLDLSIYCVLLKVKKDKMILENKSDMKGEEWIFNLGMLLNTHTEIMFPFVCF